MRGEPDSLPVVDDLTLVYLCPNLDWCDDGFHVAPPIEFEAFYFTGDVDEFTGENGYCFPLEEGKLITGYRMSCGTWWANKPERVTVLEAKKRQRF